MCVWNVKSVEVPLDDSERIAAQQSRTRDNAARERIVPTSTASAAWTVTVLAPVSAAASAVSDASVASPTWFPDPRINADVADHLSCTLGAADALRKSQLTQVMRHAGYVYAWRRVCS
jgi:hypothetical protein